MSAFNKDYSYGGTFTYGGTGVYGGLRPQERIAGLDSTYIERKNDGLKIDKKYSEEIQVIQKQDSGLAITANLQSGVATNPNGLKYDSLQNYDDDNPYDVSFMRELSSPADLHIDLTKELIIDII